MFESKEVVLCLESRIVVSSFCGIYRFGVSCRLSAWRAVREPPEATDLFVMAVLGYGCLVEVILVLPIWKLICMSEFSDLGVAASSFLKVSVFIVG